MSVITHLCLAVFSFPVVCFSFLCFIFSHSDHTKHFVVLLGLAQLVWHPTGWSFESATFWFHHYFSALLVWWTSYRTHDQWQISNVTWDAMQVSCDTRFLKPVSFHQVNKTDRSTVDNFWKFDFVVSSTSRAVVQVTKSCPNFNNGLSKLKKKNVTGLKLQRKLVIPVSFISYKSFFRLSLFSSPLLLFTCALPSLPSSLSHFVWAFFNITLCSWVNARYTSNMTHFIEIWHQSFD